MLVLVMGVSGAGKTTVGVALAQRLGCAFLEGDRLHPAANVAKMAAGIPLDDADRAPWLAAIRARLEAAAKAGTGLVVACSALKRQYRDFLGATLAAPDPLRCVYLRGDEAMLYQRLEARQGHYMKANMLASQLRDLEEPGPDEGAIVLDAGLPVAEIVARAAAALAP